MIHNTEDLSPDQRAAIESLLGRRVMKGEAISVRTLASVPEWLQATWKQAKERGLDQLTPDEINAEIDAYRRENRRSSEDAK